MKEKLQNLIRILKKNYENFGLAVAVSKLLESPYKAGYHNKITEYLRSRHDDLILECLRKKYIYVIDKYKDKKDAQNKNIREKNIWVFWYQGEELAPKLIKQTIQSIREQSNGKNVVVLDKDSMKQYVKLPEYIIDKVEDGEISLTHLSDILRAELLRDYGGLWIDSSIFVSGKIPEDIFEGKMWTMKKRNYKKNDNKYTWYWTGFLFYAEKGTVLFQFLVDFFEEYWKKEHIMIEYLLIDYAISLAYHYIPQVKTDIDNISVTKHDFWEMEQKLNQEYSELEMKKLMKYLPFHKLTYKRIFDKRTKEGKKTFYGWILEEKNDR